MIPARAENITKRNVFLNAHFRIEPCAACPIPGYLIVTPKVRVPSLAQLPPDAQRALGVSLAAATHAIELVVRPQRVYCALSRRRPHPFTSTYFRERTGCYLLTCVLIRKTPTYLVHECSIGHAQLSAGQPHATMSKLRKQSLAHSTKSSNQSMKPMAPFRNKFSVFVTAPCRGLSPSR
jgi:hypothetical protein